MNAEISIKLNKFQWRWYQLPILDAIINKGYKRVIAILPRRAGKDIAALNMAIRMLIERPQTIYYIFPTYAQARKVIWQGINNDGMHFLDYIPPEVIEGKNGQEMVIRFKNGSILSFIGSDNYNALMGTNPSGIIFSEYALQDERAYPFLRPILTANGGWALFISTPRGKNHLYTLFQIAQNSDDWFCYKMGVDDTQHISLREIDKERAEGIMSEDLIQQEYYCFAAGQYVLTSVGCKPIESIFPNEMVVAHTGRNRRVLKTIEREYKGPMMHIHSYGSCEPIVCTPDHPIRVYDKSSQSYVWKKARDIALDDRLVFPKMKFGDIPIIKQHLCMLIAWYITEGSCSKNAIQWTLNKNEVYKVTYNLDEINVPYEEYENGEVVNVVVNSTQFVDFFKTVCGLEANDKRIPFHLIHGYEDEFFHELIKGDGCYNFSNGHEKYCFTTVSKTLAYQIQLLANSLGLGYAAGISKREAYTGKIQGRIVNCQESYQVNISFPGLRAEGKLMRAKYCIAAKIISIEMAPFEGKVYNLKVQYDESYLVGGRSVHNCSFDMGVEGGYYTKYFDKMRLKGQITQVPWEPAFKVHTAWDIGVRDSTSIIFFQCIGATVRVIDYYEKNKEGLEHYVGVLESKPYSYGKHIAPHDIRVREFGSGITRIEKARQLGIRFTIAEDIGIMDGIEAVRSTLSKVWIDELQCKELIKALENYRQEYDSKRAVYKTQPLHDKNSHAADSFRYLCVSLPKTSDSTSAEELDRRYQEALYGTSISLPNIFRSDIPNN